jgi:hypothetical protein
MLLNIEKENEYWNEKVRNVQDIKLMHASELKFWTHFSIFDGLWKETKKS